MYAVYTWKSRSISRFFVENEAEVKRYPIASGKVKDFKEATLQ